MPGHGLLAHLGDMLAHVSHKPAEAEVEAVTPAAPDLDVHGHTEVMLDRDGGLHVQRHGPAYIVPGSLHDMIVPAGVEVVRILIPPGTPVILSHLKAEPGT